jgi:hypothetical protein
LSNESPTDIENLVWSVHRMPSGDLVVCPAWALTWR